MACTNCYTPRRDLTVDEILLGFRGRCSFRMYIKNKLDKYGLKFFALNDPATSYLIYALPYLGKQASITMLRNEQKSEYFLRRVTEPIHGTGRNITCDNWFTSIPLVLRMKKDPYNVKITGTIKKNKKEILAKMKVGSKSPPESKFCHAKDMTLVSYCPKKKIKLYLRYPLTKTSMKKSTKNQKLSFIITQQKEVQIVLIGFAILTR